MISKSTSGNFKTPRDGQHFLGSMSQGPVSNRTLKRYLGYGGSSPMSSRKDGIGPGSESEETGLCQGSPSLDSR
ncbi:hypothetical protein BG000_000035 [Podila horticola]|nr:hypothetical protein BG000_000035 [Podila horticola]